jgi:phosphate transporter
MPYAERLVGGVPVLALLYLVTMFSLNILTVVDFNSFNWHMLILIGGGSILGDVIKSSHLLEILAKGILDLLSGPTYVQYAQIVLIITVVTSCISHTVGAIILMPLLVQLGLRLGIPTLLTFSCALAISGAMALPFSSFPNLNALTVRSETGSSYLTPGDLIKRGVPLTLLSYLLIVTVGFLLIVSAIPSGLSDVFLGA